MEGLEPVVVRAPDPSQVSSVTALLERVGVARGRPALSEGKERELRRAAGRSSGEPAAGSLVAVVLIGGDRPGEVIGYAQLDVDRQQGRYAAEVVVDLAAPGPGALADRLVDTVVEEVRGRGGGSLRLWVPGATDEDDARAERHGFRVERTLLQMRCVLPLDDTGPASGPAISTRPFEPGRDEGAWLETNNRAFATHPEQGHWELATLLAREREPWFDPDGLLLLEVDGRIGGSCWTKVHRDADPPLGEIYVIGVDPDYHGRGWGRALTRVGLEWLAGRGLTVGMLYVDADNRAALSLYRSMGFVEHHADRAYRVDLDTR
jgi:mycothiol synthase